MRVHANAVKLPGLDGYLFLPLAFEADFLARETVPESAVAAGRWIGLWGKVHLDDAPPPQKLLLVFQNAPGPMALAFSGIDRSGCELHAAGPSMVCVRLDQAGAQPGAKLSFLVTMTHVAKLMQVLRWSESSPAQEWPPRLKAPLPAQTQEVAFEQHQIREEAAGGTVVWELVLNLQLGPVTSPTDLMVECDRHVDQAYFFLLAEPPLPEVRPSYLTHLVIQPMPDQGAVFRVRWAQPELVKGERIGISVRSKQMVRVRRVKRVL